MNQIKPANYWRRSKKWSQWLGCEGRVVAATHIKVAGSAHALSAPYAYVIVKFDGVKERKELMGAGHEQLRAGDRVRCVLRRNPSLDKAGLVEYLLKAVKV
jgi:uncharacterized OB-fold protein